MGIKNFEINLADEDSLDLEVVGGKLQLAKQDTLSFDGVDDEVSSIPMNGFPDPISTIYIGVFTKITNDLSNGLFGASESSLANRFGAVVPFTDMNIYWDFGATSGAGRISTAFDASWFDVWAWWEFMVTPTSMSIDREFVELVSASKSPSFSKGAHTLNVGRYLPNFLTGEIAHVAILNRIPSLAERQELKKNNLDGSETDLLLHFSINEGSGSTVDDSSENNNDGTITGALWQVGGSPQFHESGQDDILAVEV